MNLAQLDEDTPADEIGVPLSITVDYQTKKDMTVTLRERDSWNQVRNSRESISELARGYLTGRSTFSQLGTPVQARIE